MASKPSILLSHETTMSRRRRYSFTIASTSGAACAKASTTPACANELAQVVRFWWHLFTYWRIAAGATIQPMRHPVIDHVFEAAETVTVRSSIPGRLAMLTCSPS